MKDLISELKELAESWQKEALNNYSYNNEVAMEFSHSRAILSGELMAAIYRYEAGFCQKPIDKVTVKNMDVALRMCGITLGHGTIDKIIDLVELIEEKGDETTMSDIFKLREEWK